MTTLHYYFVIPFEQQCIVIQIIAYIQEISVIDSGICNKVVDKIIMEFKHSHSGIE